MKKKIEKIGRVLDASRIGRAARRLLRSRRPGCAAHRTPPGGKFEVDNWMISDLVMRKIVPVADIHPFPVSELALMASAVCGVRPTHIFEWGTHIGKSARVFYETVRYFGIPAEIHSIDLPDEAEHEEHPRHRRGELVRRLKGVHLHQGDGLEVSRRICENLSPDTRTLFFLDGDHSYASVKRELSYITEHFPAAAVLIHDTFYQVAASNYNIGPYQAVEEALAVHPGAYERIDVRTGLPGMTFIYPQKIFA